MRGRFSHSFSATPGAKTPEFAAKRHWELPIAGGALAANESPLKETAIKKLPELFFNVIRKRSLLDLALANERLKVFLDDLIE